FWTFILAAPDFELATQDPAQQDEKAECRSNQDDRVEDEDVDLDAEIALVRAEENIRAAAATIIILLHLGVRDQIGDFLVDVDLLGRDRSGGAFEERALERPFAVENLIDKLQIIIQLTP